MYQTNKKQKTKHPSAKHFSCHEWQPTPWPFDEAQRPANSPYFAPEHSLIPEARTTTAHDLATSKAPQLADRSTSYQKKKPTLSFNFSNCFANLTRILAAFTGSPCDEKTAVEPTKCSTNTFISESRTAI